MDVIKHCSASLLMLDESLPPILKHSHVEYICAIALSDVRLDTMKEFKF